MKANLFALFCITLFVLSAPQAFAEDTNSTVTTPQTAEENSTEALVTEVDPTSVKEQQDAEPEPTETVTETQESAPVETTAAGEVTTEESVAPADTEANKKQDGDDKVQTVQPVDETNPDTKTAPVAPEAGAEDKQDSTEQVAANKSDDVVAAPAGEENTTEENAAATDAEVKQTTESKETDETNETIGTIGTTETNETDQTTETTVVPTEAPGSNNATNATNAEPSAPVSSPEENQEAAPAAEENQETAPAAESEEQLEKKDGLSFFGLISKILVGLGLLSVVILVGCVYHYRYQMQKYKIAPFTPPSFLPECLFPRNTESSGRLISGYTELQVGNYQSAPRFAEI